MTYQNKRGLICVLVFNLMTFCSATRAEMYNDETIRQSFKSQGNQKTHDVMVAQRQRLEAIMDGFITGDAELIYRNADDLNQAMQEVVKTYPPRSTESSAVWTQMSTIVAESQAMKKELSKNHFREAYQHYTQIVSSCIQCHQVARPWGKFEEPEKDSEKDSEKKTEGSSVQVLTEDFSKYTDFKSSEKKKSDQS